MVEFGYAKDDKNLPNIYGITLKRRIYTTDEREWYFHLYYDTDGETFLFPEDKAQVVSDELNLCGYFAIVTSEKMTAKEMICLY